MDTLGRMPWRKDLHMYATDEDYARIKELLSRPRPPDQPGTFLGIPIRYDAKDEWQGFVT